MGLLNLFVGCLCEISRDLFSHRRAHVPLFSVCFAFPIKQTFYQPHTLALVRPAILWWVESFLHASGKALWLDWLVHTVKQCCERRKIFF